MINRNQNLSQKFSKVIYWGIGGIIAIVLAFQITASPYSTAIFATLIITTALIAVNPLAGLYLLLLLPIAGELFRITIAPLPPIFPADLLIPILLAIWTIRNFGQIGKQLVRLKTILLPLAIFYLIAIFSLFRSLLFLTPQETLSGSLYLFRFVQYSLLCVIAVSFIRNKKDFTNILKVSAISAILLAIAGFIQLKFFPDLTPLEEIGWDPHINRLVSTWLDPNFLGGFFAFIICMLSAIAVHTNKNKHKIGLAIIITILGTALFLTYSRSAYLALLGGIFVISLLKSRKLLIIALILLTLGLASSERARQRTAELTQSITSIFTESALTPDPTAKLRIQNWQQSFALIQKRPLLGSGFNTLKFVNHKEGFVESPDIHSASGSDSSLLTVLATTGAFGLIVFLFIGAQIAIMAYQTFRKNRTPLFKGFALGLLSGLCALFVHSFFVNSLLFAPIMIFLWIETGLLLWIARPR